MAETPEPGGAATAVFTVGHSTHSLDRLVELLRRHGVGAVADVRTVPRSRRHPHFSIERLPMELPEQGLEYHHLRALGGWRRPAPDSPNGGWRNESFRGYADHMASAEFRTGLAELEGLARERSTAMMCSEGLWWRCHRRLVADALLAGGWRVSHILPDGKLSEHALTPFAEVEGERVRYPPSPTLC